MQLERHSWFTCSGFGSRRERSYVWCERRRQVEADPSCGCCLWEREPGTPNWNFTGELTYDIQVTQPGVQWRWPDDMVTGASTGNPDANKQHYWEVERNNGNVRFPTTGGGGGTPNWDWSGPSSEWAPLVSYNNPLLMYYDPDGKAGQTTPSKWGGFLDPVPFEPTRYGIPPRSLPSIDPAQLLSLEVARRALEDAGYGTREFDRERTAVVFGTEGGSDLSQMHAKGMAALSLTQDGTNYFDYHHNANDTLDKIVPGDLAQNVAVYAAFCQPGDNSQGDCLPFHVGPTEITNSGNFTVGTMPLA